MRCIVPKAVYGLLIVSCAVVRLHAADTTCTSAGCHEKLLRGNVVHAPAAEHECEICHEPNGRKHPQDKGKEFTFTGKNTAEPCQVCHEMAGETKDMHPPVAEKECLGCHEPHASSLPHLIRGKTEAEVCVSCHSSDHASRKFVHGPVAAGACNVCHKGHGSLSKKLLAANAAEVCQICHTEKKEEIQSRAHVHGAITKKSCTGCHNPHASEVKYQLNDSIPGLCFSCHPKIKEKTGKGLHVHGPLLQGRKCLTCHDPHASNYTYNLRKSPFDLCMSCHDKPLVAGTDTLENMKKLLNSHASWHGPVKEKNCSGCHDPHGSTHSRHLLYKFPAEFYSAFDTTQYRLCFQCHEKKNVLEENSALTNFRDGKRNLHYLHVNRTKGRTCRACHEVHASDQAFHIRGSVPFGNWDLPLNYTRTAEGGSCTPGCHKVKEYRR